MLNPKSFLPRIYYTAANTRNYIAVVTHNDSFIVEKSQVKLILIHNWKLWADICSGCYFGKSNQRKTSVNLTKSEGLVTETILQYSKPENSPQIFQLYQVCLYVHDRDSRMLSYRMLLIHRSLQVWKNRSHHLWRSDWFTTSS